MAAQGRMLSQMILTMPRTGTARMAPGTPHIQYQKTRETMTTTGFSVNRRATRIGVMNGIFNARRRWSFNCRGRTLLCHDGHPEFSHDREHNA
jgi:hypothetical protein